MPETSSHPLNIQHAETRAFIIRRGLVQIVHGEICCQMREGYVLLDFEDGHHRDLKDKATFVDRERIHYAGEAGTRNEADSMPPGYFADILHGKSLDISSTATFGSSVRPCASPGCHARSLVTGYAQFLHAALVEQIRLTC